MLHERTSLLLYQANKYGEGPGNSGEQDLIVQGTSSDHKETTEGLVIPQSNDDEFGRLPPMEKFGSPPGSETPPWLQQNTVDLTKHIEPELPVDAGI